jgi:hypothetical protein
MLTPFSYPDSKGESSFQYFPYILQLSRNSEITRCGR